MNPEKPTTETLTRKERLARRLLPAVAVSLAAGGYALHELDEYQDARQYHDIATVTHQLGSGDTPIGAIKESLAKMNASMDGETFDVDDLNVVREGQELSRELHDATGQTTVQPGDTISVTLRKNDLGNYEVEADPGSFSKN